MTRPNAEIVRVGMGFKPLEFSINDITVGTRALSATWLMTQHHGETASDFSSQAKIKVQPMITHRLGLSQWQEGFDKMAKKKRLSRLSSTTITKIN